MTPQHIRTFALQRLRQHLDEAIKGLETLKAKLPQDQATTESTDCDDEEAAYHAAADVEADALTAYQAAQGVYQDAQLATMAAYGVWQDCLEG